MESVSVNVPAKRESSGFRLRTNGYSIARSNMVFSNRVITCILVAVCSLFSRTAIADDLIEAVARGDLAEVRHLLAKGPIRMQLRPRQALSVHC